MLPIQLYSIAVLPNIYSTRALISQSLFNKLFSILYNIFTVYISVYIIKAKRSIHFIGENFSLKRVNSHSNYIYYIYLSIIYGIYIYIGFLVYKKFLNCSSSCLILRPNL